MRPVMRIQAESLLAVHSQPLVVVSRITPLLPAGGISRVSGATAKLQLEPAWIMVKIAPPAVIVPVRACTEELVATL